MRKKGDITIETIVLIALALIFLLVVVFVMTGKISLFSKTLGDCKGKGGICTTSGTCQDKAGSETGFSCTEETDICCIGSCELSGGTCKDSSGECGNEQEVSYTLGCPKENQVCCK